MGSVSVGVNGDESNPFKTGKCLRQGDPLSPILFNLVADVLTKMLYKAANAKLISRLLDQFRPGGIITLQYANDALLFSSHNLDAIRNLKCMLMLFECVSGIKINFHKSEFVPMNLGEDQIHEIAHILNCHVGNLPLQYLEVPLHFEKLRREDLQPVVDKMLKRAADWRGKLLAYSSRLTLIRACLASIPIYLLSFIKFPKWAIKLLESQMSHCLWNNNEDAHKYHLAGWKHVTMKKEYGRLGVPDLRELNLCLLGSWITRYICDKDKIWKQLVDFKYKAESPNILCCKDSGASNFWQGVMWATKAVRLGYRWNVGDGKKDLILGRFMVRII
jgi:hypothetical protein